MPNSHDNQQKDAKTSSDDGSSEGSSLTGKLPLEILINIITKHVPDTTLHLEEIHRTYDTLSGVNGRFRSIIAQQRLFQPVFRSIEPYPEVTENLTGPRPRDILLVDPPSDPLQMRHLATHLQSLQTSNNQSGRVRITFGDRFINAMNHNVMGFSGGGKPRSDVDPDKLAFQTGVFLTTCTVERITFPQPSPHNSGFIQIRMLNDPLFASANRGKQLEAHNVIFADSKARGPEIKLLGQPADVTIVFTSSEVATGTEFFKNFAEETHQSVQRWRLVNLVGNEMMPVSLDSEQQQVEEAGGEERVSADTVNESWNNLVRETFGTWVEETNFTLTRENHVRIIDVSEAGDLMYP